ncbi:DUF982 domain-containing protein [Rhizobium sp. P32RR-XVIII]|uniref:DUF982 domain-containing protein n=1 Tax=Rhizobium sp. P32RR-XVIII TaxID=2726738 RepID=UPI0014571CC9|nr:DUF982 domain-containing protein [Rhizobium sp. P32RR-XVIII]NLS03454.1 DUF982 domain-containing protein [Rhizobium sp. P32RR-XVIII]
MQVDDRAFQPVNIKVGDRFRVVATVADAYRLMVTEWPLKEAPALYRAEVTCLDAFNDAATPEDVRKKFLIAASEAHLQYVV